MIIAGFNSCKDSDPNRIAMPVCACIVKGTAWTKNPNIPGDWVRSANATMSNMVNQIIYDANDKVWIPGANIALIPQINKEDGYIKVIDDPDQSVGQIGDIEATPDGGKLVAGKCREAWGNSLVPDGLIIVIAHKLIFNDGTATPYSGFTEPYDAVLARNHGADLCGFPQNLNKSDVKGRYILIMDPKLLGLNGEEGNGIPYVVLAHEFGHTLMLGHGDGLDNDGNGKQAGEVGPRLFDFNCDFHEWKKYDDQPNQPTSLMGKVSGYNLLVTPLQRECARAVAPLFPGAVGPY